MKRVRKLGGAVLAAAALCISSAAFMPTAASASASGPSTWCTDSVGSEVPVTDWPVALAVEVSTFSSPEGPHNLVMLCWSTTPRGSIDPEANGGSITIWTHPNGSNDVTCSSSRTPDTVVAVDCYNAVNVTDPDATSAGVTVTGVADEGPLNPIYIAQTGAESGGFTTTSTSSSTETRGSGACVWVLGSQLLPGCSALTTNLSTTNADLPQTGNTGSQCLAWTHPSYCDVYLQKDYVVVGSDTSQDTVSGTVNGTSVFYLDIPRLCLGFCP